MIATILHSGFLEAIVPGLDMRSRAINYRESCCRLVCNIAGQITDQFASWFWNGHLIPFWEMCTWVGTSRDITTQTCVQLLLWRWL